MVGTERASAGAAASARRHDLDALRGFAMLLGIVLHGSFSFMPIPWFVRDSQQSGGFFLLFSAIHGFRMPLFFLLSGYFTMLLYRRRGLLALLHQRTVRILVPCLLGLVTVLPLTEVVSAWAISTTLQDAANRAPGASGQPSGVPLITAIKQRDLSAFEQRLSAGDDVNTPDAATILPLHWACMTRQPEMVRRLLAAGADANATTADENSPLHSAAFVGDGASVQLLLDGGANANRRNQQGGTALSSADVPIEMTVGLLRMLGLFDVDAAAIAAGREQVRTILKPLTLPGPQTASGESSEEAAGSASRLSAMGLEQWARAYSESIKSEAFRVQVGSWSVQLLTQNVFGHLWFLWFLCWLVAGFGVVAALRLIPPAGSSVGSSLKWLLVPLVAVPQALMGVEIPVFGPDTSLGWLPIPHILAYYALFFAFGALHFGDDQPRGWLTAGWWLFLPVSLLALLPVGLAVLGNRPATMVVQPLYAWCMCFGLMGLFERRVSQPNALIRYLADASYWMYLMHLPLVIALQVLVRNWQWPVVPKFALLVLVTAALLLVSYALLVRHTWLGVLLNGRLPPRAGSDTPAEPVPVDAPVATPSVA